MLNLLRKVFCSLRKTRDPRLPINIWGDVVLNGAAPKIRRVLTGTDAHECMYSWVYLNELVSLGEMANANISDIATKDAYANFQLLKKQTSDPQFQIINEILDIFYPFAFLLSRLDLSTTEFVELGSTFFSAIEKLKIATKCANVDVDLKNTAFYRS